MAMRALNLFALCICAVLFTGCAGYHLGPTNGAMAGEKSVEVLPFNNQTLQPRLGDAVTKSLRQRLQADSTYHLATGGTADVVVTGVITKYNREAMSYLNTDAATPEDYRVNLTAHVTARERVSGKLILDKDVKGSALVHIGADLASSERQALPLLADDLSDKITELLTDGAW